jgi:hypothetical protein
MGSKSGRTALAIVAPDIGPLIVEVRGQRVILDADLARIYGVPTKALNQAVEVEELNRSQIVTGSQKHRDPRFARHAFTEHGAIMAANVLNSSLRCDEQQSEQGGEAESGPLSR